MRLLLASLALTYCTITASAQIHPSRTTRPSLRAKTWFEGWYMRITSNNGQDVLGVVAGSFERLSPGAEPPAEGYIAVFRRDPATGGLDVFEHFPKAPRVESAQMRSSLAAARGDRPVFCWNADGVGVVSEKSIDVQMPGGVSLRAKFSDRQPWAPFRRWRGPEGVAEKLRLLHCHWSVYSVASRAEYEFVTANEVRRGQGFVHQETNWGESFPKAYAWAQGCTPDGCRQFVLAGGCLPVGLSFREGWLLGVRSPGGDLDFRPQMPGASFETRLDGRQGRLRMTARSPLRIVEVDLSADPSTFSTLSIPTARGFVPGTIQSFSAAADVRVYRPGLARRTLIESFQITNVALEFGGDYWPRD